MLRPILLAALMLGAASSSAADPPLCRVTAVSRGIPTPPMRTIIIRLRPDCPPNGQAFVRLRSTFGSTDPVYGWEKLTIFSPFVIFRGVLPNWTPEWQAASGLAYRIPEGP